KLAEEERNLRSALRTIVPILSQSRLQATAQTGCKPRRRGVRCDHAQSVNPSRMYDAVGGSCARAAGALGWARAGTGLVHLERLARDTEAGRRRMVPHRGPASASVSRDHGHAGGAAGRSVRLYRLCSPAPAAPAPTPAAAQRGGGDAAAAAAAAAQRGGGDAAAAAAAAAQRGGGDAAAAAAAAAHPR